MNRNEAASFLGVALRTFDELRIKGRLAGAVIRIPSAVGDGPVVRYDRHKLQAYLDKWSAKS